MAIITRTFDILEYVKEHYRKDDVFASKINKSWKKYSVNDYVDIVANFSIGLLHLDVKSADKIATVFSNNIPEWNFIDMGIAQIGAVHIPIYPTISLDNFEYIFNQAEVKYVFVTDKTLFTKLAPLVKRVSSLKTIYTIAEIKGAKNWQEIVQSGERNFSQNHIKLQKIKNKVQTDDLCSIIYTSGTTGRPKGVMLSHDNFLSNCEGSIDFIPDSISDDSRSLSFLPLCHVFERMVNYLFQIRGISVYYAESIEDIANNLKEVKPAIFVSVPRVLEKIYDKIITKGKNLFIIKKILFLWAINLGLRYKRSGKSLWYYWQLKMANKIIFNKWREALGGNVQLIVSGGAALQPRLARIFWAAGIPVTEGYGLTETSPVIAVNSIDIENFKFGTVGVILDNVEVKIAEDGEILAKGPNIMLGYYKNEKLTNEAIDKDNWFHTGDIGIIEEDKFLRITDRKKEMFKLSTGKYVTPQVVENIVKESIFIDQLIVIGEGEKYVSALITPNFEFLENWCKKKRVKIRSKGKMIMNSQIVKRYYRELERFNPRINRTMQIKQFRLIVDTWSTETGELSPTLKLKRKIIKERYNKEIYDIYNWEYEE